MTEHVLQAYLVFTEPSMDLAGTSTGQICDPKEQTPNLEATLMYFDTTESEIDTIGSSQMTVAEQSSARKRRKQRT